MMSLPLPVTLHQWMGDRNSEASKISKSFHIELFMSHLFCKCHWGIPMHILWSFCLSDFVVCMSFENQLFTLSLSMCSVKCYSWGAMSMSDNSNQHYVTSMTSVTSVAPRDATTSATSRRRQRHDVGGVTPRRRCWWRHVTSTWSHATTWDHCVSGNVPASHRSLDQGSHFRGFIVSPDKVGDT